MMWFAYMYYVFRRADPRGVYRATLTITETVVKQNRCII